MFGEFVPEFSEISNEYLDTMLGNIIRLWVVSADKVKTTGYNRSGTRTGFQLKFGCTWTEIPLLRDTTKSSGTVDGNSDFKLLASSLLLNTMRMVGRRYACKYLTSTGATYVVGDGRAFYISTEYTTGKQPGDMAGVNITLLGSSRYAHQWLMELPPSEDPVDPPVDPPVIPPIPDDYSREDFNNLNYVSIHKVGTNAAYSQPSPGILRLELGPTLPTDPIPNFAEIHAVIWFSRARNISGTLAYKLAAESASTQWLYSTELPCCYMRQAQYPYQNTYTGSIGVEVIPDTVAHSANFGNHTTFGIGLALRKLDGEQGTHSIDIDYLDWTFAL